jgi:membrane fusion protein, multidrug efflux system
MIGRVTPCAPLVSEHGAHGVTRPTTHYAALFALLAGLCWCGCSGKSGTNAEGPKQSGSPAAVPALIAQSEAHDVPVELRNIGNVEAYSTVTIRSQVTGQITKVHFHEGDEVKLGDMLFSIDSRPAEGALRQAQADLKRDQAQLAGAKLEFERQKKLLEQSITSQDEYEKSEASFQALEATVLADEAFVNRARLQLEFTSIRSPIDGRTGNLMVKEGNVVKAPDDAMVVINQVQPIYVTFSTPEQDLPSIRQRLKDSKLWVEVEMPSDSGEPPRGELSFIDNAVDTTTGRIKLKATFPNTNNVLWPGQFVQTKLTLRTLTNATVVPARAIQSSQNGDFVFIVQPDSTVQKRPIVAGLTRGGKTVIESGVRYGDTVVIDGQLRLRDGSLIKAQEEKAAQLNGAKTP